VKDARFAQPSASPPSHAFVKSSMARFTGAGSRESSTRRKPSFEQPRRAPRVQATS
jgi:hypothetical protein